MGCVASHGANTKNAPNATKPASSCARAQRTCCQRTFMTANAAHQRRESSSVHCMRLLGQVFPTPDSDVVETIILEPEPKVVFHRNIGQVEFLKFLPLIERHWGRVIEVGTLEIMLSARASTKLHTELAFNLRARLTQTVRPQASIRARRRLFAVGTQRTC